MSKITDYGFEWDNITVERMVELPQERGRVFAIRTPRQTIEVYVTPTGLIRVFRDHVELKTGR